MTGTECFRAALNILSETPDSGVYYEQFALGALNQLLANSLREINAERASNGEAVLLVPPRMTALDEELPAFIGSSVMKKFGFGSAKDITSASGR